MGTIAFFNLLQVNWERPTPFREYFEHFGDYYGTYSIWIQLTNPCNKNGKLYTGRKTDHVSIHCSS
jgi:hypothetical protein